MPARDRKDDATGGDQAHDQRNGYCGQADDRRRRREQDFDRNRLFRPHARSVGAPFADGYRNRRQGRPAYRSASHGRGCRHRPGPGLETGGGRFSRHRALCRRPFADGRNPDPGRRSTFRAGRFWCSAPKSRRRKSANSTPSWCASFFRPSPSTPRSRCISRRFTAPTAIISSRPASRAWRGRSGAALAIDPRQKERIPSTKGVL